jgi:phosphatidylinositol-3,4,5-trisphosphate 3-phosphatase/dual-specificity protein phosphatase PTEN
MELVAVSTSLAVVGTVREIDLMIPKILKGLVAVGRQQYSDNEVTLDLAYVTPYIIVTSMPTSDSVKIWYRNSCRDLREFLKRHHGTNWRLWNFRAEKSGGYDDKEFDNSVVHYPFSDHRPPPFELILEVVNSIDKFLQMDSRNVAVLHCKAGQGRSGTMLCAYLIVEQGYSWQDANQLFTEKRMRRGFGQGVSILSQQRYLRYTQEWRDHDKFYSNEGRVVEIKAIKVWNPRYRDLYIAVYELSDGQVWKVCTMTEKEVLKSDSEVAEYRPKKKICVHNDIGVEIKRYKAQSVAHSNAAIWFNAFFETFEVLPSSAVTELDSPSPVASPHHPTTEVEFQKTFEQGLGIQPSTGSLRANWIELDGLAGSSWRGRQSFDAIEIIWNYYHKEPNQEQHVSQTAMGG